MLYGYITILAVIVVAILYMLLRGRGEEDHNLMEDVPSISINKESLEKHAFQISQYFSTITRKSNCRRKLIKSLDNSYGHIIKTYEYLDKQVKQRKEILPAAEWMIDNLYLIEREYKDIKHNMPMSYYKGLPVIKKGIMKGYARCYHIAVELISHTDGAVDEEIIETFIKAYQKNSVLTTGELWALPIMIRIALIQNISKIAEKIIYAQQEKQKAETLAEKIIEAYNNERLEDELRRISLEENIEYSSHFVERLLKVVRDNGVDRAPFYKWIDDRLILQQTTADKMIIVEHQKQGSYQISMGNSVTSIRAVAAINWRDIFEEISMVEKILQNDPANIYCNMDFESRDHYRHKIEKLSKTIDVDEVVIAQKAIECAKNADSDEAYIRHIGYYLIDDGISKLKKVVGGKRSIKDGFEGFIFKHKTFLYLCVIAVVTILLSFISIGMVKSSLNPITYVVAFLVLLIPCSEIVISILHWSINKLLDPKFIPKMELSKELPEDCTSMVVIPTLLSNKDRVLDLIGDLEVYYLANQHKNLYFGLLGDFKDGKNKEEKEDKHILELALNEVKRLNDKYSNNGEDIFYFFNRYRQYNDKENIWIGWERKRGKLMEFNALLRGELNTSYDTISGDITKLQKVKYVITLDADTQLPRETAKKLIGAMCHVLNKPHVDEKDKRVKRGYGLMQPRVSVGTIAANKTVFSKIFSGETGIDKYTTAISDVYNDFFGEGIFTGKGIYDVDIFNYMLKDEIPENTVLSHDLLEGSYVRTALVTDIELIDGYPAYYNSSSMRLHRWVRGDWQIIKWITKKSPLNTVSRWKIFDNLRRSILAPSIILLTLLSFVIFPHSEEWIVIALLAILCPILFDVSEAVVSPIKGISLSGKIGNGKTALEQTLLIFCFLPYQAYLMMNAIIKTLYRVFISKKNLLEWQTAADVESKLKRGMKDFISFMWQGSAIALLILAVSFLNSTEAGLLILPSCILWFLSPVVAYYISSDIPLTRLDINKEDTHLLRILSRKTWAYFEDFVNKENNWLAPDNYQADPPNGVATRTSPTNMGMGITSNLAAYDLGYIGVIETVDRLEKILSSMDGLIKYKGHFYNWYDTVSKEPLYPRYVSTVDSGNLVGYLWVAEEALEEYKNDIIVNKKKIDGLCDVLELCNEEIELASGIKEIYSPIISDIREVDLDIISWRNLLTNIRNKALEVDKIDGCRNLYWNNKLKSSVNKYLGEVQRIFPWVDIFIQNISSMDTKEEDLKKIPSNTKLIELNNKIDEVISGTNINEVWWEEFKLLFNNGKDEVNKIINKINRVKDNLHSMAENTDFSILYNKSRNLFAIGYDIERDELGNSYYDLLASESRQASFIAVAKGDVEQRHWFSLGRAMTLMDSGKGLVSWSGTMFEYYMPLLIMRNYPDTLLNETYREVIGVQQRYGRKRGVPWGISESAFYTFDISKNYQYKAFGVPSIGLKRGLANELVVSPYSTVMGLQIDFKGSLENIKSLKNEGLDGKYGFYEAIDYTKDRLSKDVNKAIVKCFMVHHQGMSLMALTNVLNHNIFQDRFHRIPRVKATELLLQEKVSKRVVYDRPQKFEPIELNLEKQDIVVRTFNTAKSKYPEGHLLSNGNYSTMITNSGSGYGKLKDMTVYRWREDLTLDNTGMFFYIKNLNSNEYWSAAYSPCGNEGEEYEVIFSLDKAEFRRKDGNLTTYYEITVSQEDNAEVRRISITNHSEHSRTVEVTSYAEATLAPYNADIVHPTFSNLFIRTEYVESPSCVIANRRPRAKGQKKPHVMQTIAVQGEAIGTIQYETSRANFLGRGRAVSNPIVMDDETPLKNTVGAVLDPIISMRRRLKIRPGETVKIAYTTAVGDSREEVIELAKKYSEMRNVEKVFEASWTQTQMEMKYLGIKSTQANIYQLMASKILFLNNSLREREDYIKKINKAQSSLWPYGISGDVPILLIIIRDEKDLYLIKQGLQAHEYWDRKGLKVDFVVLNLQNTLYIQPLQEAIKDIVNSSYARDRQNIQGGVFLHSKGSMAQDDIEFLISIARFVIDGDKGSLIEQIELVSEEEDNIEYLSVKEKDYGNIQYSYPSKNLDYYNGVGGFDTENDEYVIILKDNKTTPAPWINVVSNGDFGFHISESGSSYTWYKNSRENKISTWSNDPITDPLTEGLYVRDEITGKVWGISARPLRDKGEYIAEHGFGYSRFKHFSQGILGEMTTFCPMDESVRVEIVKLKNHTNEERKLSLTYYSELSLGVVPQQTVQYISSYLEEDFIYAQNPYSEHFGRAFAYLTILGGEDRSFTGNRSEFLGRGGNVEEPEALKKARLSNVTGAGYDPCLACNTKISLKPDEEIELIVLFGQKEGIENIKAVINRFKDISYADNSLVEVKNFWRDLLHRVQVKTPDKTMDIMLNGWLMYQTLACRYWARTAFYQSGGAMGFRDQLQDVMSIGFLDSSFTKEQIIRSATRQFVEGDVQHWWHPVVNSGIRTRFSDDLLWLPYVTIDYIKNTGDYSILDEEAVYLEDEPLREGEDERYKVTPESDKKGSIYEHCIRAIEISLRFGEHNIPLMGSGDWNDGMSTVGNEGKGESVWLGWFLYSILDNFKEICKHRNDEEKFTRYEEMRDFIGENLEKNAWDGGWYRRAYFDDGTPLGSIENDECQIDSLSQSWAVISGAGRKERVEEAMRALEKYLIKEDKGIVLLLTPPFNNSKLEPGYIKGYIAGVRENGGQYTHAATWVILAMAKLGYGYKAWKTFHMINPINHSKSHLECERYKVEPYVMTADVYGAEGHEGRGGWSWYTGTSGWMFRVGIEGILGLKLKGDKGFTIEPAVPDEWNEYEINYRKDKCSYNIKVVRGEKKEIYLDGKLLEDNLVPYLEDGEHIVKVII